MTQEDKELFLKDLSARLPYGVMIDILLPYGCDKHRIGKLVGYSDGTSDEIGITFNIEYRNESGVHYNVFGLHKNIAKPYLRSLKSMTDEEKKEIEKITNNAFYVNSNYIANFKSQTYGEWHGNWHASYNNYPLTNVECNRLISWLDKKHFDHRTDNDGKTLIEKGLAIEVTEENNPYK